VDADAHSNRARRESRQRLAGRLERIRCRLEGDEEGIPLRVDLDTAMG
jgi:hypothetical protein